MVYRNRIFILMRGATPVHTIHVIHHAIMSGLCVSDLLNDAAALGIMPSEILTESWLRRAASTSEDLRRERMQYRSGREAAYCADS